MNVNSATSSVTSSTYSSNGLSGLMSGIDTETMVQKMLSGVQTKIDKQEGLKKQTEWKQELYRTVISDINSFKDKYFDSKYDSTLATNLAKADLFASTKSAVTSGNDITVTGSTTAKIDDMSIVVRRLATAATLTSSAEMSGEMSIEGAAIDSTLKLSVGDTSFSVDLKDVTTKEGMLNAITSAATEAGVTVSASIDEDGKLTLASSDKVSVDSSSSAHSLMMTGLTATTEAADSVVGAKAIGETDGATFTLSLDGVQKTITISPQANEDGIITADSIGAALQEGVYKAFGTNITVDYDSVDKKVTLTHMNAGEKGHEIAVYGGGSELFGVSTGASSMFSTGTTLESLGIGDEGLEFSINGVDFSFSKTDDISVLMRDINNSDAGVKISYSSVSDKFSMTATSTGSGFGIDITETTGTIFNRLFGEGTIGVDGNLAAGRANEGQDALIDINGVSTSRSSNTFAIEGVTLTLNSVSDAGETNTISTVRDTDKIVDTIKSFVNDYNTLVKKLNEYVEEDPDYKKYAPLTDAQKEEMTDSEVELWEEKTKKGLLYNDSDISAFLSSMRSSLYTKPEGNAFALYEIGIETAAWTSGKESRGQLTIDETALRTAIENDAEAVSNLFTDSENGLSTKIMKIIDETASTSSGSPGTLVTKAGVKSGATDKNNEIYRTLKSIDDKISELKDKYERDKERYWSQFTAMETAMSNYNSQLSYLTSMFSTT